MDEGVFREIWTWSKPILPNIYDYITYDDDLRAIAHVTRPTFDFLYADMYGYLEWPKNWYKKVDDLSIAHYDGKKQKTALSKKDRFLRFFMFAANKCVHGLEELFNQGKSIIYADFKFIAFQFVKALGTEWNSPPAPFTAAYSNLIGKGVLSEDGQIIFPHVPYIADVTSIRINRPKYGQRTWYNGHKKYHTADFQCVHDGTGRVHHVSGPSPGSYNDIQQSKKSIFFTQTQNYLEPNHMIAADLAYYYVGYPYLTKIHFQESYSLQERMYNDYHAKIRVISENYYCRFKTIWPIFEHYTLKLDHIGFIFRAFIIITNVVITRQDPLRKEFK